MQAEHFTLASDCQDKCAGQSFPSPGEKLNYLSHKGLLDYALASAGENKMTHFQNAIKYFTDGYEISENCSREKAYWKSKFSGCLSILAATIYTS